MATYTNITGAQLVVNNEFGYPISFKIGETKSGVSSYLERYTSVYQTGENVMLKRVGDLDADVMDGVVPAPVIEEENMAVRPAQPNTATQGVNWGTVGGVRNANLTGGYSDASNTSTRLRRVGFNTEKDVAGRQIDTRYLDIKPASSIALTQSQTFTGLALNGGTGADRAFTITTVPVESNGRRATEADAANPVFGSLLAAGKYYTAFGTATYHDNSANKDFIIGFKITGTTVVVSDVTCGGACTTLSGAFVCSTGVLTWTRADGEATDTIATTIYTTKAITTATIGKTLYGVNDGIRGWYSVSASTATAGVLLFTDAGVLSILTGGNPTFVAW